MQIKENRIRRWFCLLVAVIVGLITGAPSITTAHAENARLSVRYKRLSQAVPYQEAQYAINNNGAFGLSSTTTMYCCDNRGGDPKEATDNYGGVWYARPVRASQVGGVDVGLLRKVLYYAPGGPGWSIEHSKFGWSEDFATLIASELTSFARHGRNWYHTCSYMYAYERNDKGWAKQHFANMHTALAQIEDLEDPYNWGYDAFIMERVGSETADNYAYYPIRPTLAQSLAFIHGVPIPREVKDSKSTEVTVDVSKIITCPIKQSESKQPLAGAKADIYLEEDGVRTKIGTATSGNDGLFRPDKALNITKSFSTGERTYYWIQYGDRGWENAPNPHPEWSQNEAECRSNLSRDLTNELNSMVETWKAKNRTVVFVETTPPTGYLKSTKEYKTTINYSDKRGSIPNIINEKAGDSLTETLTKEVTVGINVDIAKVDGLTEEPLTGGNFDVYIKNGADWEKLNSDSLHAVDGKIQMSTVYKNSRTYKSESYKYVYNWDKLSASEKTQYKQDGWYETKAQAQEAAKAELQKQWEADQATFSTNREVKVVETKAPDGYGIMGDGIVTGTVNTGVTFTATIENDGQGMIAVLKTDSDRKPLANAKFEVRRKSDNKLVDSWTSEESVHYTKHLQVNTEYVITETGVPTGYVEPITRSWTVTSSDGTVQPEDVEVTEIVNWSGEACKQDTAKKGVAGAVLTVTDKNGQVKDKFTTDGSNHKITNLVENETYTMTETQTPAGYVTANPVTFTIKDKQISVPMIDTQVFVKKVDKEGNMLSGAQLQVIDEKKNVVDSWTTDGTPHAVSGLKQGGTYTLQEVAVPNATYQKSGDITFTVDSETEDKTVTMTDYRVSFSKKDVGGEEVEGAHMSVIDKNGNKVDEWVSTKETHYIENLVEGEKYVIHEDLAPVGMNLAQDIEFTAIKDNQHFEMVDTVTTVLKVDADDNPVAGATLRVVNEAGQTVDEWVSTETPHFVANMKAEQKYQVLEVKAPNGFVYANPVAIEVSAGDNVALTMMDTQVEVGKQGENGNYVKDAVLQVVDKDGNVKDEWTTGKQIVKLPFELTDGVTVTDDEGITYTAHEVTPTDATDTAEEVETDTTEEQVEETDKLFRLTYTDADGLVNHTLVDSKGIEQGHLVSNLTAGETYTLVEKETPQGYVKANEMEIKALEDKNSVYTMIDKQVKFTKEDITGEEIEGAEITVTDEEGNEVDKWISTDEPHYIENLENGKKYTLKETIAPGGYTQASEFEFEVNDEIINAHYKMVDTLHRLDKVDEKGQRVKGARISVYTKDGKKVDEWVSGQHILNITEENLAEVEETGEAVIKPSKGIPKLTKAQKDEIFENVEKALVLAYPTVKTYSYDIEALKKPPVKEEPVEEKTEDTGPKKEPTGEVLEPVDAPDMEYTTDSYLSMAFEMLGIDATELDTMILESKALMDKGDFTSKENKDQAREDLKAYINTKLDEYDAKVKESNKDLSAIYLRKGIQDQYIAIFVDKNGRRSFYDIDRFGDETTHRISGMTEGETYVVKEIKSPAGYMLAPELEFVADSQMDLHLTMLDMVLLERQTGVTTPNYLPYISGATILILLGIAFWPTKKRKIVDSI